MKHVILDMDPGVDDALAIILAMLSPELRVEAITTVSGNVHEGMMMYQAAICMTLWLWVLLSIPALWKLRISMYS